MVKQERMLMTKQEGMPNHTAMSFPRWEMLPDIDLYMDQVIILLEKYLGAFLQKKGERFITASMVNNYVKQGIIPAPVKKRYNRSHLAYLMMVVSLKQIFSMEEINRLLEKELSVKDIREVYDDFCASQEHAFIRIMHDINGDAAGAKESSALELAVLANAGKILAVCFMGEDTVIPADAE